jgi:hypothetical protein
MEKLNRGDKIYLDADNLIESNVNTYLECRDGIIELYEYNDSSGYGSKTRLFYCQDTKHETVAIIRQTYNEFKKEWIEETISFDSDSFNFLIGLLDNKKDVLGGSYSIIRDYSENTIKSYSIEEWNDPKDTICKFCKFSPKK